ncbi:hypothetical protein K4K54_010628 [Colletotrichum sp. SAR 10_86]|nr:hypothetical protein K4K54_010628 [Colletotrichum sp. SAR 10_86]KAI8247405.1 hypothetical protein K4K53_001826 [Colletotrichum sp. SAR 10_77]
MDNKSDHIYELSYRSPTTPSLMSPDAVSVSTTNRPLLSEDSFYEASDDKYFDRKSRRPWHVPVGDPGNDAPKRVIQRTAPRLLTAWLPHAPAIAVTCVLIWMSHSQIFWYPETGPDLPIIGRFGNKHTVISNVLQFASKLHELMVVASLAAIALSMFRRRLVGDGVRLGFLTGGYRLGDLAYLTSGAFWGLGRVGTVEVILVAFVVFGTIMSTIIGPASAILFVPNLGWYNVPAAFDNVKMPLIYTLEADKAWPQILDSSLHHFDEKQDCLTTESIFQPYCYAGGFSDIWNWLGSFRYTDLDNNLTFSSELGRRLELHENSSVALFTTPPAFVMNSLGLLTTYIHKSDSIGILHDTQRYKLTTKTPMKQPFMQGRCAAYDKDELLKNGTEAVFPMSSINCYGDADCLSLKRNPPIVQRDYWNVSGHSTSETFNLLYPAAPSVKSVVTVAGTMPYASKDMEQKTWVYACAFLGRWVPSEFSVDPESNNIMDSNVSSPDVMNKLFHEDESNRASVMQIDKSWLAGTSPLFNMTTSVFMTDTNEQQNTLFETSPLRMMMSRFLLRHERADGTYVRYFDTIDDSKNPQVGRSDTESFLAKLYGVFLTDAIARIAANKETRLVFKEEPDNLTWVDLAVQNGLWSGAHSYVSVADNATYPTREIYNGNFAESELEMTVEQYIQRFRDDWVQIDLDAERHGYGSGQFSKTLEFALVMMYIYLGVVGVYGGVVLVSQALDWVGCAVGDRRLDLRGVTAWSDLQDLVLLALRSAPPPDGDLTHVGAGVGSNSVWKKVVKVRVEESALQLVLHDHEGLLPPQKGEKYS